MTQPLTGVILADLGGLLLLPIGLLAFAFWIWMIVDCAKHENDGTTKVVWLLIILLVGIVGAPLFFFVRHAPRRRSAQYQPTTQVYQPWDKGERIR